MTRKMAILYYKTDIQVRQYNFCCEVVSYFPKKLTETLVFDRNWHDRYWKIFAKFVCLKKVFLFKNELFERSIFVFDEGGCQSQSKTVLWLILWNIFLLYTKVSYLVVMDAPNEYLLLLITNLFYKQTYQSQSHLILSFRCVNRHNKDGRAHCLAFCLNFSKIRCFIFQGKRN